NYAALSPDGNLLATGQFDGVAKLWNLETGQEEQVFEGHDDTIMAVDFHPTEQKIATASMDGSARVWDMATGEELLRIEGHEVVSDFFTGVLGIAYSPDGRMIATSGGDGKIRTWDAATGEALLTLDDWDNWATWVAFSPDGSMLASGGELSNITIWDPQSGQELLSFPAAFPDRDIIWRIEFSPDGRLLAVSGTSGVVKIWAIDKENANSQLLATLTGHVGIVRGGMDFSSDGRLLATSADDGTRLWDLSQYEDKVEQGELPPAVLTVPGRNPLFNPEGDLLMTLVDGSLLGFTLDNDRLLELAQSRVTRSLTTQECDRFNIDPCPLEE
ncbi:MAG: WD40 repeat domain-containing protein, partial [Candidatus Promineifilaceae bacterium]